MREAHAPDAAGPLGVADAVRWQSRMPRLSDLDATYYDGESVFYQIADYTGDLSWLACADKAEKLYRDGYVFPNNGNVPGYWNFTRGLTTDALRTGDTRSAQAVHLLATNGALHGYRLQQ